MSLCKISDTWGGGIFDSIAIIWTQDKATYQISKAWAF